MGKLPGEVAGLYDVRVLRQSASSCRLALYPINSPMLNLWAIDLESLCASKTTRDNNHGNPAALARPFRSSP